MAPISYMTAEVKGLKIFYREAGPSGAPVVLAHTYDQAGNRVTTLGLSDNLLLGALVAVFALAVLGLVTAGGHRGSWRQH